MSAENEIELNLARFRAQQKQKVDTSANQEKDSSWILNALNPLRKRITTNKQTSNENETDSKKCKTDAKMIIDVSKGQEVAFYVKTSDDEMDDDENDDDFQQLVPQSDSFWVIKIVIKIMIYILLQTLAVILEFGAVFFSIAVLYFICTNLRNRKKLKGELSAYSVFNPGCKPIHGTVTADQLQGQMGLGGMIHQI